MQFLIFLSKERQIHICLLYVICAITYWKKVSSVAWLWVSLWVRNWKWNNLILCCRRRNTKSSWSIISNKRFIQKLLFEYWEHLQRSLVLFLIFWNSLKKKNNYLFKLFCLYRFFLFVSFQWVFAEQPACVRTTMLVSSMKRQRVNLRIEKCTWE